MLWNLRTYHRPDSLAEAVRLAQAGGALLAGGTELVGRDDLATEQVIDLRSAVPAGVILENGQLCIGAMTTLRALAEALPGGSILARAVRQAAPATIRAAATLGGTLAGVKGGAEIPTALLALGAVITLARADGEESLPLGAFLANREACLDRSVITCIKIPALPGLRTGLATAERSPADRAILVAAAAVGPNGERRVAVGGLGPYPRLVDPGLQQWPAADDFRAGAAYRRAVAPVLIRRALEEAEA